MFKIHWSTVAVLSFGLILSALAFFAEVFQGPPVPQDLTQLIQNPIPLEKLNQLKSVGFTNKMGSFKFENAHPQFELDGPWQMIQPTNIKARKDFFVKVLKSLSDIQVRHTHRADTINLQSFSLDKPLFSFVFETKEGSLIHVSFGLINPIDNSTYFSLSDSEMIYQSNTLSLPLESVTPDELLDSKALALNNEMVSMIEIQVAPFQSSQLKVNKIADIWQDNAGKQMDVRKLDRYINDLQNIKSYMVLDKLSNLASAELDKIISNPNWKLKIAQREYTETFFVAGPLNEIGDLKLDRPNSLLFFREGTTTPIVLAPEMVQIFKKNDNQLR